MPYTNNTLRRAEQILGYGIAGTPTEATEHEYAVVDGVAYVDLFSGTATVEGQTDFKAAFNGRVNGISYFNEVIFANNCKGTVKITAKWGSDTFMTDIAGLLDWLEENNPASSLDSAGVQRKAIEDFDVSYRTSEEKQNDLDIILHDGYGFYIRKPFILDVSKEQRDAGQSF